MIVRRSQAEIAKLRRANQLVGTVLGKLRALVAPGVTTEEIDALAEALVLEAGATPAFKGYHGYPATVCASVNEQVVHGIPSKRPLVAGDIVSLDMGAVLDGYYGDSAVTVPVGEISAQAKELLRVTEESLFRGIEAVRPGARVSDIGAAVQQHVEAAGFSVVREFVGHGIGTSLHEEPQVPNYGPGGSGPRLAEGMVLAIEPMVNVGSPKVKVLSDDWTAVSVDGSLSAHFEHTVVVSAEGCEILTLLAADAERARQLLGAAVRR
jgi:methionyl aminopeptidase